VLFEPHDKARAVGIRFHADSMLCPASHWRHGRLEARSQKSVARIKPVCLLETSLGEVSNST
jgi:hypothetical protein